jgi:quinol monooxygenase YgiN
MPSRLAFSPMFDSSLFKRADGWQSVLGEGIMPPIVVLVEFLVKPSFSAQFRDLIAANAKASLHEIYEDQAAFDEHLASSHYLIFADAIEDEIEQRSISRLVFFNAMATSESNFT